MLQLFSEPKEVKQRALFGMAFHSLVSHFPEWYRLASLRSLNAEELELGFYDIKSVTNRATNRHADNILEQNIIRSQYKRHRNTGSARSISTDDSHISRKYKHYFASKEADNLIPISMTNI